MYRIITVALKLAGSDVPVLTLFSRTGPHKLQHIIENNKSLIVFGTLPRCLSFESSAGCTHYTGRVPSRGGGETDPPPWGNTGSIVWGVEPITLWGSTPQSHGNSNTLLTESR